MGETRIRARRVASIGDVIVLPACKRQTRTRNQFHLFPSSPSQTGMLRSLLVTSWTLRIPIVRSLPLQLYHRQKQSTMSFPHKPNTEPPKDMTVFKNLVSVASQSGKFRRVLWTGRNSQVNVHDRSTRQHELFIAVHPSLSL